MAQGAGISLVAIAGNDTVEIDRIHVEALLCLVRLVANRLQFVLRTCRQCQPHNEHEADIAEYILDVHNRVVFSLFIV